ncbi:EF-hand domain-containing protein [Aestuariivirga sp.]|uniref:EF-hand domain-containing protein n=1 Tax=Aestuariivirga sp. TaxID=2650926 RepID=UPI0039E57EFC
MKTPAKILAGLLLGATVLAAVPVLAQNATPTPPQPPVQNAQPPAGPDAGPDGPPPDDMAAGGGDDDGGAGMWGHRMGGHHGWARGNCGGGEGRHARWGVGDGEGRGRMMGEGRGGGRMMAMLDSNGDGAIGDDEAAALADRMFSRIDSNGDGSVSQDEFTSGPRGRGMKQGGGWRAWLGLSSDEAAAVQKVRADKFAALDTDKNGSLSKQEFFAEAKARFAAADTDKDGKVTPWEFRAQRMN